MRHFVEQLIALQRGLCLEPRDQSRGWHAVAAAFTVEVGHTIRILCGESAAEVLAHDSTVRDPVTRQARQLSQLLVVLSINLKEEESARHRSPAISPQQTRRPESADKGNGPAVTLKYHFNRSPLAKQKADEAGVRIVHGVDDWSAN